jgi:hypothetical protein
MEKMGIELVARVSHIPRHLWSLTKTDKGEVQMPSRN